MQKCPQRNSPTNLETSCSPKSEAILRGLAWSVLFLSCSSPCANIPPFRVRARASPLFFSLSLFFQRKKNCHSWVRVVYTDIFFRRVAFRSWTLKPLQSKSKRSVRTPKRKKGTGTVFASSLLATSTSTSSLSVPSSRLLISFTP